MTSLLFICVIWWHIMFSFCRWIGAFHVPHTTLNRRNTIDSEPRKPTFHSMNLKHIPVIIRRTGDASLPSSSGKDEENENHANDLQANKQKRRRRKDGKSNNNRELDGSEAINESTIEQIKEVTTHPTASNTKTPVVARSKAASASSTTSSFSSSISTPTQSLSLPVMDVRDLVSGKTATTTSTSTFISDSNQSTKDGQKQRFPSPVTSTPTVQDSIIVSNNDDSLARLLSDAKRMREQQVSNEIADGSKAQAPQNALVNVISSIVTIDFFVVCGLLLWFLAGIFCSYILKDDTVQIAFNGIFQPVVQPALGILMIGSAMGALFKKSDN